MKLARAHASLKLSRPDNLRDLLALLAEESSVELLENADDLINHAVGQDNAAIYRGQLPAAVRAVERGEARRDRFAAQAYDTLALILSRVRAGETLEEIERDRQQKREARSAEYRRERDAAPAPKDKLSDEWCHWKIRQLDKGFTSGSDEERARAGSEFYALLKSVTAEHTPDADTALRLLPHLIEAQQSIWKAGKGKGKGKAAAGKA